MMKKRSHHYCGRQVHWLTERKSSLIWPWPLHFPMSFFRAWGLGVPQKVFQVQPINNNQSIFFFPATLATNNWQIKGLIESKTSSVHKGQTAAKVASRECCGMFSKVVSTTSLEHYAYIDMGVSKVLLTTGHFKQWFASNFTLCCWNMQLWTAEGTNKFRTNRAGILLFSGSVPTGFCRAACLTSRFRHPHHDWWQNCTNNLSLTLHCRHIIHLF